LLLSYCLEQSTSSSVSCVYFLSNYTNQVQWQVALVFCDLIRFRCCFGAIISG
jgi:hypothetical protein